MDKEEAQFILRALRPEGQDDADPRVAEALELARRDPELGRWLEEERAFDRAMAGRLAGCPVPEGLKESILAGGRLVRPAPFWRRPSVLAIAACFTVLLVATMLFPPRVSQARSVDEFAVDYVVGLTRLSHKGESFEELRPFLRGRAVSLPAGLVGVPTVGCCEGWFEGRKFSIICFRTRGEGLRPEVHLLVFDRADLPDLPGLERVMLRQHGDWSVACWSKDDLSYVLAKVGDAESLQKLL